MYIQGEFFYLETSKHLKKYVFLKGNPNLK